MYQQCVGIPMGTDCVPLLANLFLFYYEYRYMKNHIKNNIIYWLKNNKVYLTLNNPAFDNTIDDIYPPEL